MWVPRVYCLCSSLIHRIESSQNELSDVLGYLTAGAHDSGVVGTNVWRIGGLDMLDPASPSIRAVFDALACSEAISTSRPTPLVCRDRTAVEALKLSESWFKDM